MSARLLTIVTATALVLGAFSSQAQYAFNSVAPARETVGNDPEDGAKPVVKTYRIVHGVVQNQQGALAGATVWLHGTRTMVVTNAEGEFELRVPTNAKSIELTCGYAGLQDEVIRLAPATALGSLYLLRPAK